MNDEKYATNWKEIPPAIPGFKGALRTSVRNIALSTLAFTNKHQDTKFLRALFCHYVFDDQREQFERLIVELRKIGTFIDTPTCLEMLAGEKPIDRGYFHLSFDDGFRNIFTNAYPIMKKYDIPALIFVPSGLVETDWHTAWKFGFETTQYRAVIEMIKWEELKEMASAGYEVGSHTKTHARFSDISKSTADLENEIIGSKHEIEAKLGKECKYISWPFGRKIDADETSLQVTVKAGYEACFGAFRGTIKPHVTDIFGIPRHNFEPQWPLSHVLYFAKGSWESSPWMKGE